MPARTLTRWLGASALAAGALAAVAMPPAASAASTCTVAYSVVNSWPGGFQAGITVTNNGAPVTSWALAFTFPNAQQISGGSSATYPQNGQYVTVTSESYNGALGTGGSVSLGFTGTVGSTNAVPTYFTVNGYACNGAAQVPSVNITSPASGAALTPGSTASITANASEPTASISKVEFFEASTLPRSEEHTSELPSPLRTYHQPGGGGSIDAGSDRVEHSERQRADRVDLQGRVLRGLHAARHLAHPGAARHRHRQPVHRQVARRAGRVLRADRGCVRQRGRDRHLGAGGGGGGIGHGHRTAAACLRE